MRYQILVLFMLLSFCSVNAADSQEEFTVADEFTSDEQDQNGAGRAQSLDDLIMDELIDQQATRLKLPVDERIEQIQDFFAGIAENIPDSLREKCNGDPCKLCNLLLQPEQIKQMKEHVRNNAARERTIKALIGMCVLLQSKCQQKSKMAK